MTVVAGGAAAVLSGVLLATAVPGHADAGSGTARGPSREAVPVLAPSHSPTPSTGAHKSATPSAKATEALGGQPAVPQGCGQTFTSKDNPLTHTPWPLQRLRPDLAWPISRGRGVTVAVIDSGVSANPPVLSGQVLTGKDYVATGHNGACDEAGHGTMVGAIIAGRDDTSSPYHGVAPDAKILPIRVLRDTKTYDSSQVDPIIADAIHTAVDQRVGVINLSLNSSPSAAVWQAVQDAESHNIVVVAAAGNQGAQGGAEFPAAFPGVLAVAGVDKNGARVQTSSTGNYVDVAAPGDYIEGPGPQGDGYGVFPEGGTSFAAPYVSGVAALLRAHDPSLSASQIAARITGTADHPAGGWDSQVGYGVVNPYRALTEIMGGATPAGGAAAGKPLHAATDSGSMSTATAAATGIAVGALALAGLAVVGAVVIPRGRRRGWRPGRRDDPDPADPPDPTLRPAIGPAPGPGRALAAPATRRALLPPGG